jgi:hypothetical protein
MELRARHCACVDPAFQIQVRIWLIGSGCSTGGDTKCEKQSRGEQRLFADVFVQHDEAGQDSVPRKIENPCAFRNADVVGISQRDNPATLDDQDLIQPRGSPGSVDDANVLQCHSLGIAKQRHRIGQCWWRLRETGSERCQQCT